jgi:site-specific DNA-methyltransferase (adenine-specific)
VTETGPGWRLNLSDCLDPLTGLASLGDKSVDHVITDPPYSERVHRGQKRAISGPVSDLGFGHLTGDQRAALAPQFCRVATRWIVAFCAAEDASAWANDIQSHGWRWFRFGAWVKPNAMPRFSGDGPSMGFEALTIFCSKGKTRWNGGGSVGVWTYPTQPTGLHETAKPLPLMEALVSDFTDPGELVCDPFAGSGTTGVACIRLGRRFIGWERDPKYFAVAVKRLRAAREQLGLFERPAVEKFKQSTLTGTDT